MSRRAARGVPPRRRTAPRRAPGKRGGILGAGAKTPCPFCRASLPPAVNVPWDRARFLRGGGTRWRFRPVAVCTACGRVVFLDTMNKERA